MLEIREQQRSFAAHFNVGDEQFIALRRGKVFQPQGNRSGCRWQGNALQERGRILEKRRIAAGLTGFVKQLVIGIQAERRIDGFDVQAGIRWDLHCSRQYQGGAGSQSMESVRQQDGLAFSIGLLAVPVGQKLPVILFGNLCLPVMTGRIEEQEQQDEKRQSWCKKVFVDGQSRSLPF